MTEISVLVRVHRSNTCEGLRRTVRSLLQQTRKPDRILLIEDKSVVGELHMLTYELKDEYSCVDVIRVNQFLNRGEALRVGINEATEEYLAILDCGDISIPGRVEIQLRYFAQNDCDVTGGHIQEFRLNENDTYAIRKVPTNPIAVEQFAKHRSPVNQPTACFKREAVLDVGNYRALHRNEDYDLWVRMICSGKTISNVNQVLSKVDAGEGLYKRRGGSGYVLDEIKLFWTFYTKYQFITFPELVYNLSTRIPVRILPSRLRGVVYNHCTRD